jgi:glycosyltransferase involved in cell wall biosynthesis
MRVLCVLSSSNQMYSGIGRNVFELAQRLADRVAFEFAIDDAHARNVELVGKFALEHAMPLHVGRGISEPDALDAGNRDLRGLIAANPGRWDAVECLCWANAATNAALLEALDPAVPLVYTPHDQPLDSVPMTPECAARTDAVHGAVLDRADLVLADSPHERRTLLARTPGRHRVAFLPLGCDFDAYSPGPHRRPARLLFVGDLAEPRKRFDRVLDLFAPLREHRPDLRLVVIGNRSESAAAAIPADLRSAVDLLGYVDEPELRRQYGMSQALVQLSDCEAFGIPILEALACATPVILSHLPTTTGLFGIYRGARFVPPGDAEAALAQGRDVLDRAERLHADLVHDRVHLRSRFDWSVLAQRKWDLLAAAWARRAAFAPALSRGATATCP